MRRGAPLGLVLLAIACSGESIEPTPRDGGPVSNRDAGVERDGGTPAHDGGPEAADAGAPDSGERDGGIPDAGSVPRRCEPQRAPIAGGGASLDPLDGELEVFVLDRASGEPVVEADVVVYAGTSSVADTTDGVGCVVLRDAVLTGTVSVSVFADTYTYRTVVGFDRARITMPLIRTGAGAPVLRPGRAVGIVDGFEVLTSSSATRTRVGVVAPIRTDVFRGLYTQRPRIDGSPFKANVAALGGPSMANLIGYDVVFDAPFTSGLVVWGGTLVGDETIFTHLGVSTGLQLEPDEVEMGRRLTIATPLDSSVVVRHGATIGLVEKRMYAFVAMPDGNLLELGRRVTLRDPDPTFVAAAPSLAGAFVDATYGAVVTEWQQSQDRGAFSTIVVRNADTSTTVDVGPMPVLPTITTAGRSVTVDLAPSTSTYVRLEVPYQWTLSVASPLASVEFPPVPPGHRAWLAEEAPLLVTGLGLEPPIDVVALAARDPYAGDRPLDAEFARAIRRWVQDALVIVP